MRLGVWVVGLLLLVGLGSVALAGSFSGSLWVFAEFHTFQPLAFTEFESVIAIDYTACGWTLGTSARFELDEFDLIWFTATGSVGAIDFYSIAQFYPVPGWNQPFFDFWNSTARSSLAGMNAYCILLVSHWSFYDGSWPYVDEGGIGLIAGGWGSFGTCSVWAQVRFNVYESSNYYFKFFGYDEMLGYLGMRYEACYDEYLEPNWDKRTWLFVPEAPTCSLPWSGINIIVDVPLACFDVTTELDFDCEDGFYYANFFIEDIHLGLPWLRLAYLDIWFSLYEGKEIYAALDLVLGDYVCFIPYISLDMDEGWFLDGIALNALLVEYNMGQGVIFKAGHRFSDFSWYDYVDPFHTEWYGFSLWGEIISWDWADRWQCVYDSDYDEYIAIEIDGDSCCGGLFDAAIYNWFETEKTSAFMDWAQTDVIVEVGIGPNTTLLGRIELRASGLTELNVALSFVF